MTTNDAPKAWITYCATTQISDANLQRLFPGGVPQDLDAEQLVVALKARHGDDVGGYMPESWEVQIEVEAPNPAWVQDETLLPEQSPGRTICTEAPW